MTATTDANWAPLEARLNGDVEVIREFMWMFGDTDTGVEYYKHSITRRYLLASSRWPLFPAIPERPGRSGLRHRPAPGTRTPTGGELENGDNIGRSCLYQRRRRPSAGAGKAAPPRRRISAIFVGKPCRNKEAPQLEREVASEAEGLVAAFKTDASLFLLSEYTVMQRIESGRVTLGKEPTAAASQRVSTVNAS